MSNSYQDVQVTFDGHVATVEMCKPPHNFFTIPLIRALADAFEGDIAHDQLWFSQVGQNLQIDLIGSQDRVTVNGWFNGTANHVEVIEAGGHALSHTNVSALVQAMAAFAPPGSGETTLSSSYQQQLNPTLAAVWAPQA